MEGNSAFIIMFLINDLFNVKGDYKREAINKDRHKPGRQGIMETMPKVKSLQFIIDGPLQNSESPGMALGWDTWIL